jgi:hypothetical protein
VGKDLGPEHDPQPKPPVIRTTRRDTPPKEASPSPAVRWARSDHEATLCCLGPRPDAARGFIGYPFDLWFADPSSCSTAPSPYHARGSSGFCSQAVPRQVAPAPAALAPLSSETS